MYGHVSWNKEEAQSYARHAANQAKRQTKASSTSWGHRWIEASSPKNIFDRRLSTAFARVIHKFSTQDIPNDVRGRREYNEAPPRIVIIRVLFAAFCCLSATGVASAATEAMLFRLFLTDGTSILSYGEFARVDDRVIFSMVMGGTGDPRLHAATLPASAIDWARTDRHAASTRYQWYAQTRGEEDFLRLSNDVAAVLNQVVLTRDRAEALEIAQRARVTLAQWPRDHYGYRQRDVREILAFLDEVISDLRVAAGTTAFDVALVAHTPDVVLEPVVSMPPLRDQIDQALRVATLTERPAERVALLQAALQMLDEAGAVIPLAEAAALRRDAQGRIREEQLIDKRYSDLARRLMVEANRGAARARVGDVQRVFDQIAREDQRLGRLRPEIVQALHASVQSRLEDARRLRLMRDRWEIRVSLYRDYQRSVGAQMLQLVKSQPALEAIRRLDGPPPDTLVALQARMSGGADRLDRIRPPGDLESAHNMLVGAWRFAENAIKGRYEAARAANVSTAWEASSAAAGALLLLSRVQQEIRQLLEPPQLQ